MMTARIEYLTNGRWVLFLEITNAHAMEVAMRLVSTTPGYRLVQES